MIDGDGPNESPMKRQDEIKKELSASKVGSGNYYLKYHMIRKILEQKDASELQKFSSQGRSSQVMNLKNENQTSRMIAGGIDS